MLPTALRRLAVASRAGCGLPAPSAEASATETSVAAGTATEAPLTLARTPAEENHLPRYLRSAQQLEARSAAHVDPALTAGGLLTPEEAAATGPLALTSVTTWLSELRARDVTVINVQGKDHTADHLVVFTASTERQIQSILDLMRRKAKAYLRAQRRRAKQAAASPSSSLTPSSLTEDAAAGTDVGAAIAGQRLAVEGEPGTEWFILDLNHIAVHGMTPRQRAFVALEDLWRDVPSIEAEALGGGPGARQTEAQVAHARAVDGSHDAASQAYMLAKTGAALDRVQAARDADGAAAPAVTVEDDADAEWMARLTPEEQAWLRHAEGQWQRRLVEHIPTKQMSITHFPTEEEAKSKFWQ
ncbi:hypothetical protein CXG81DRAFT_23658 [Caulochytrium protostelioides]|uniref:Uncharacterized protein n=1 Tax=Caulochytrium protostelioides TaxID=1555241 RepID=A0A4P9XDT1_9FUNG|nr:hypothetical protein CXG81DRAFT_23658 [Caulochytrium protostelioides]|eukprot:RKP03687.1 hypothetical protein CXG81DRAFT_23658 [Caulochytrium protostelioides]